jgi:LuxR family transcriptional regulator, maltose regulon positive regulatory protein
MIAPTIGEGLVGVLQSPQPPPPEAILTTLLNDITTVPDHFMLVLDDYHVLDARSVDLALTFLLDHLPPQMHLAITTREDPQLPLPRLRARGALTELHASDLRFTPDEGAAFLNQVMGLSLNSADLAVLEVRTEGWVAGLQLAALAMRDHQDRSGFIRSFSGSNRYIVDYLAAEVFMQQPAHIQTFLLQTAILDRMCSSLCDTMMGLTPDERPMTNDEGPTTVIESVPNAHHALSSFVLRPSSDNYSQLILDQLDRDNLFVVRPTMSNSRRRPRWATGR